jgi:hypothetical protein
VIGHLERPAPTACPPGEPCDPPATATILVFTRPGHPAARVLVGASGRFRLHLAAGRYRIRAAPPPAAGRLTPSTVRVPRRGIVRLHLSFR